MQKYFEAIFEPVKRHGGMVVNLKGDSFLAIWAARRALRPNFPQEDRHQRLLRLRAWSIGDTVMRDIRSGRFQKTVLDETRKSFIAPSEISATMARPLLFESSAMNSKRPFLEKHGTA